MRNNAPKRKRRGVFIQRSNRNFPELRSDGSEGTEVGANIEGLVRERERGRGGGGRGRGRGGLSEMKRKKEGDRKQ